MGVTARALMVLVVGCLVSSCWQSPDKRLLDALQVEEDRLWEDIQRLNKEEPEWLRCTQDSRVSQERFILCQSKFMEAMGREKAEQEVWNRLLEIHGRFQKQR